MTPRRVAKELGVCRVTVYRWANSALRGEPSPLRSVSREPNGRIRISREEVIRVRRGYRIRDIDEW